MELCQHETQQTPQGWSYALDTSYKTLWTQLSKRIQLVTHSNSHCLWYNDPETKLYEHEVSGVMIQGWEKMRQGSINFPKT